jgi:hypothetical protein
MPILRTNPFDYLLCKLLVARQDMVINRKCILLINNVCQISLMLNQRKEAELQKEKRKNQLKEDKLTQKLESIVKPLISKWWLNSKEFMEFGSLYTDEQYAKYYPDLYLEFKRKKEQKYSYWQKKKILEAKIDRLLNRLTENTVISDCPTNTEHRDEVFINGISNSERLPPVTNEIITLLFKHWISDTTVKLDLGTHINNKKKTLINLIDTWFSAEYGRDPYQSHVYENRDTWKSNPEIGGKIYADGGSSS